MNPQLAIDFETRSPINVERIKGQNKRLYDFLMTGASIHCFHPARQQLRIGYLNSRISDLVEENVPIEKRRIKVPDVNGDMVSVVEYSIEK